MKDNKPWYERIYIWIGIIAGIFGILGISISGIISNKNASVPATNFENNKIDIEDQSTFIINNGEILNYGGKDSDNNQNTEQKDKSEHESETEKLSVTASYHMNAIQSSIQGIDVLITAETTFDADCVTITYVSELDGEKTLNMHGAKKYWEFTANFYVKGRYKITVTAYAANGDYVTDTFTYKY